MSRRWNNEPKLDLFKLNLNPPPRTNQAAGVSPPNRSPPSRSPSVSPTGSCISLELNEEEEEENKKYSNSSETKSMVVAGCLRCLMYVMLPEEDPKCPKCKSTVLLDVIHERSSSKKWKKNIK